MKEIQVSEGNENKQQELPAPKGIGMAVALDWGLAVQILLTPIVSTFFSPYTSTRLPIPHSPSGSVLFFVIAWPLACLPAYFGEMVRRGRRWTLWIQIVANALLSLGGLLALVRLYQSVRVGNFWPLVTEVILVIISPLIVWRMSRPSTVRWFQTVSVADARKRHGGRWVLFIALWAIVGGILQTIAAMK